MRRTDGLDFMGIEGKEWDGSEIEIFDTAGPMNQMKSKMPNAGWTVAGFNKSGSRD
jgi:hypothetical protein